MLFRSIELANRCEAFGKTFGFSTGILDENACQKLNMNMFLAVGKGSVNPSRLIVMRYNGGSGAPIALVGKGVTYDSGGLSLKSSGMDLMRFDMNGAAAVIGAMCSIANQKLPVNVVGVVAACENAIGSKSFKNGDVLKSMNGKTVYISNTDAEGRLTMADAITYSIRNEKPCEIIEVAGLTGSVCNFYGNVCSAVLSTHQDMFDSLSSLMDTTGEKLAQMPIFPEYKAKLKSPYADITNSPEGGMGGILAGLFLSSFAEDTPFVHIRSEERRVGKEC